MIDTIDLKSILKFTLPSIAAMVFMGVYVMVDGYFVSNFIGITALSALNIAFPAMSIFFAIGTMLGTGGNAVCATLLGEGKKEEAKQKMTLFIVSGFLIGLCITFITLFFMDEILLFLGANDETFKYAYDYLFYIAIFAPCAIVQIIIENAMIASGKPKLSFITVLSGGFTNIILDYVFIKMDMGMSGISLATALGFFVPCFIGLIFFSTNKASKSLHFVSFKFDINALLKACGNGSSEMVSMLATSIITYLFNITMLNLVGNTGVSAIAVILYAQVLINSLFIGYTMGISPVISFNFGERNERKLAKLFELNIKFILSVSIILFVFALLIGDKIVSVFAKAGTETYDLASHGLLIFSISFLFAGLNIFASGMFTAYSNGKISAFISFLRTFFFIAVCLLILPQIIGINGVWLAVPIAECLSLLASLYFIYKSRFIYLYAPLKNKIV